MKIFDFLDLKYRSTALDLQKQYSPFTDGKVKAAHSLINICRTLSKWFHMPLIIADYLLVELNLKAPPKPLELIAKAPKDVEATK